MKGAENFCTFSFSFQKYYGKASKIFLILCCERFENTTGKNSIATAGSTTYSACKGRYKGAHSIGRIERCHGKFFNGIESAAKCQKLPHHCWLEIFTNISSHRIPLTLMDSRLLMTYFKHVNTIPTEFKAPISPPPPGSNDDTMKKFIQEVCVCVCVYCGDW